MILRSGEGNLFRQELFQGQHDLLTDVLKMSIYLSTVDMGPELDSYITTGEITHGAYTPGGNVLTGKVLTRVANPLYDTEGVVFDFDPVQFATVNVPFNVALIYNASKNNRVIACIYFGRELSPDLGGFSIDPEAATLQTGAITCL